MLQCHAMTASRTTPTLWVLVMAPGLREAGFFDPGRAGHLAVAVEAEPAGVDRIGALRSARQDDGHAGADRAFADLQRAVAAR